MRLGMVGLGKMGGNMVTRLLRGGHDRELEAGPEALPPVAAQPVVEEHRRAGLPGLLLAADHQVTHPRGAAPVHAAQLVPAPVLPNADVLGGAGGERLRRLAGGQPPEAVETPQPTTS